MYSSPALAASSDHGFRSAEALPLIDDLDLASAARSAACVLFTGPIHVRTLALRIHSLSGWRWGPFKAVDCAAPADVLERELFSVLTDDLVPCSVHGPSARLLQAGTLFLHEVGSLGASAQARLRDLLAERASERLRGPRRRIMASASELLLPRVMAGTFDDRLYYRLNVIHFLTLPGARH